MASERSEARPQLINDIWANICDSLIADQQHATAAALASTSKGLYELLTPKLYNTIRIRSFGALCLFFSATQTSSRRSATRRRSRSSRNISLPNPPHSRTFIRHVEIDCIELDLASFSKNWQSVSPLQRINTLHIKTVWEDVLDKVDNAVNDLLDLIVNIAARIPSAHFRWTHRPNPAYEYYKECPTAIDTKVFRHPAVKSIEFPPAWQPLYHSKITAPVYYNSREIGMDDCGGTWYTDPDGTEAAGHLYLSLRDRKRPPGAVKPMYIVQIAPQYDTPEFRKYTDQYEEMSYARRTAGSLTDFAIMEKMGLLDVKLVCPPQQMEPNEWRKWITGEGTTPGNGVQADLKAIVDRLAPGMPRQPFERDLVYDYAKDLLASVDLFVKIAVKRHGPEKIESIRKQADQDYSAGCSLAEPRKRKADEMEKSQEA